MSARTKSWIVSIIVSLSSLLYIGTAENTNGKCHYNINTLNCSGIGLRDLPGSSNIPENIETLDLSNNEISNFTFFNKSALGSTLKTLRLSRNQISVLQDDAFKLLTNLVSLDLSNNLISGGSLSEVKFKYLDKLIDLDMEKNPLRLIKRDAFSFMELPAVKRLDLSHCEIRTLENYSFDLPSLEYLDLSWNQLQTFKENSFRMMTNLKTLVMSHNRISVLNEVPYMPELVTWNLANNGMENIEIRAKVEDFADNLQKLYLRNNNILRFDTDSLPLELAELQEIDMSNNRLHCDCRMKWITSKAYNFQQKNYTIMCSYPTSVRGRDLLTLAPDELKCGIPLAKILVIVMICSLLLLTVSVVVFFVIRGHRRKKKQRRDGASDYTAVSTL